MPKNTELGHVLRYKDSYSWVYLPDHPKASNSGFVHEHYLIVERAFGRSLPPESQIHHVDCRPDNNDHSNLVLCNDQLYHKLLHQRTDALRACGNPSWLKCSVCKQYDDPKNLEKEKRACGHICHRSCRLARNKENYEKRKLR